MGKKTETGWRVRSGLQGQPPAFKATAFFHAHEEWPGLENSLLAETTLSSARARRGFILNPHQIMIVIRLRAREEWFAARNSLFALSTFLPRAGSELGARTRRGGRFSFFHHHARTRAGSDLRGWSIVIFCSAFFHARGERSAMMTTFSPMEVLSSTRAGSDRRQGQQGP